MRTKLTILSACAAALAVAAGAYAAGPPVTVALYQFTTADDVNAFQKVNGAACTKKLRGQAMSNTIGKGTNSCAFRTSVLADSSDLAPDQVLMPTVSLGNGGGKTKTGTNTPKKKSAKTAAISPRLLKQAYTGVAVRASDTAGYELRVLPAAHKWQFFRDPKGAPPPALDGSGGGAFIKAGGKTNVISLQAFDGGTTTTQLLGRI